MAELISDTPDGPVTTKLEDMTNEQLLKLAAAGSWRSVATDTSNSGWLARWRLQRSCFHHDHNTGESWIESRLIDLGRRKMFWCVRCERTWFV